VHLSSPLHRQRSTALLRHVIEAPHSIRYGGGESNAFTSIAVTFLANLNFIAYDTFSGIQRLDECAESHSESPGFNSIYASIDSRLSLLNLSQPPRAMWGSCGSAELTRGGSLVAIVTAEATSTDGSKFPSLISRIQAQTPLALDFAVRSIGLPTVPPMMRVPFGNMLPQLIVADEELQGHGAGSIVCAAYL
jgi:hypothetical protein